jgi:glycine/sarcosine N-methyltransferase
MIYKDEYTDWAEDYDKFGEITNINLREQEFLNKTFKLNNVKTVLDCACGTGTHLYMLSKLGYTVHGSDYSSAMLNAVFAKAIWIKKGLMFC